MADTVVRPGQFMVVVGITFHRSGMTIDPGRLAGVFDRMEQALDFLDGLRLTGQALGHAEVLVAGLDAQPDGALVLDRN